MSNISENLKRNGTIFATGFSLFLLVYGVRHRAKIMEKLRYVWDFRNPLRHKRIEIVETLDDCRRIVNVLKAHTATYKVLGFDCEWVTICGVRHPIALLQLATYQGLCALIRLNTLRHIPQELRELLEDEELIKVGVGPYEDAKKLSHDYSVGVASTFDLRFLAAMTGHKAEGLAKMAHTILNQYLDKNWRLVCSNWEINKLTDKQQQYAANDALVAVEIFHRLAKLLEPRNFRPFRCIDIEAVKDRLEPLYDVQFKDGYLKNLTPGNKITSQLFAQNKIAKLKSSKPSKSCQNEKDQKRYFSTRARDLYDNCLLQAPDEDLLCTIDQRKAEWYIQQNLGVKVSDNPLTVRLNFEPASRAVGDVGRYYLTPKENQCVVCGRRDAFIRKNVIPREYRKYFPEVMKNHTSHDILLLCPQCHQISDISNFSVRQMLAEKCDAPFNHSFGAAKYTEDVQLKKVKSAARALVQSYDKIPLPKRELLENTIRVHYGVEDISDELMNTAYNIDIRIENENYCQHGVKVVQKYQNELGGLIELEKLWRQHFLNVMHPKFMPPLWNVNHNANRLEIRAKEGRITSQELLYAGLNIPIDKPKKIKKRTEQKEDN